MRMHVHRGGGGGGGVFRYITCILSYRIGRVPPGMPSPLLVTSGGDARPLLATFSGGN